MNDTVLLSCCARDGVWRGAVRNPSIPAVCTEETFDRHAATVDSAVLQQMTYETSLHVQSQQCEQ